MNSEKHRLLDRILAWAESSPDVRGVALIGSEAQEGSSTDEWSDIDVVLSVHDPTLYHSSRDWLAHIGAISICMDERWSTGEFRESRVLFSNGVDVDFIFLPAESCRQGFEGTRIAGLARKGVKALLDKDGVLTSSTPSPLSAQPGKPPALLEFQEVAADFWFHVVYTAKKLRRGELWTAKYCCDVHMKGLLLRMIEWHARAKAGWDLDVRYKGRFLEQWADPSVVEELSEVFARYDEDDIWRALLATGNLFSRISKETGQRLSYDWLERENQEAMYWAGKLQSERSSVSNKDDC